MPCPECVWLVVLDAVRWRKVTWLSSRSGRQYSGWGKSHIVSLIDKHLVNSFTGNKKCDNHMLVSHNKFVYRLNVQELHTIGGAKSLPFSSTTTSSEVKKVD